MPNLYKNALEGAQSQYMKAIKSAEEGDFRLTAQHIHAAELLESFVGIEDECSCNPRDEVVCPACKNRAEVVYGNTIPFGDL